MTLWLANLLAYSMQLAVLVVCAATAAVLLRRHEARTSELFWHVVFIGACALPLLQPWSAANDGVTGATLLVGAVSVVAGGTATAGSPIWFIVASVIIAGAILHLGRLAMGLARLHGLRARARPFPAASTSCGELIAALGTHPDVRLSDEVSGPVTFGVRRPTVLLPPRTLAVPSAVLQAILCHELLHVRRRDWLWTVAEACWSALFWFHPAARFLVARLSLTREMVVDQETVALTKNRRAYAAALLTFAEDSPHPLVAATPFFERGGLAHRIALVAKENPMRSTRTVAVLGTALVAVAVLTVVAIRQVPLASASPGPHRLPAHLEPWTAPTPTAVRSGNGLESPRVVRKENPQYTPEALAAKVEGSVWLDVLVQESGDVGRVDVFRSLDKVYGLDAAAVDAAWRWRFEPGTKDGTPVPVSVIVEMTFTLRD